VNLEAFTVVELLTAMAIIGILMCMVVPFSSAVRDLGRRTVCGNNLHQIGLGICAYADSHNDKMPTPSQNLRPYDTCVAFVDEAGMLGQASPGRVRDVAWSVGPGVLYTQNYIPAAGVFYCPSQPKRQHQLSYYPSPWGTSTGKGGWCIRTSYNYDPYTPPYVNLSATTSDWVLMLDLLTSFDGTAHATGPGWNVLFADGHFKFKKDQNAYNLLAERRSVENDWQTFGRLVKLVSH